MRKITTLIIIIIISTIFSTSFITPPPAGGNVVVIVNKDNPIATLSAGEAKLYFLRKLKSRWPGINKNIRPVTRKSKCVERDSFYSEILKMSDTEVDTYFAERQFQNAEKSPERFNNDDEVVAFVEQEVGGIGFISAKAASAQVRGRVKVVLEF